MFHPTIHCMDMHSMKLQQPNTKVDSYLYLFFPSAIKIWNNLPEEFISCTSLDQFKTKLAGQS